MLTLFYLVRRFTRILSENCFLFILPGRGRLWFRISNPSPPAEHHISLASTHLGRSQLKTQMHTNDCNNFYFASSPQEFSHRIFIAYCVWKMSKRKTHSWMNGKKEAAINLSLTAYFIEHEKQYDDFFFFYKFFSPFITELINSIY